MSQPHDPQPDPSPSREPVTGPQAPPSYADYAENPDQWVWPFTFSFVGSVTWDMDGAPEMETRLNGTVTILIPLQFDFSSFVLAGVAFAITSGGSAGSSAVGFVYEGPQSVSAIRNLFQPQAKLEFS